ncbi:hypothetical protein V6R21_13155 [Limibacter armeniacum]|uniref:hypothetical protein n=1 Tax=Limibacter armeniacum TaxID=466084 RepID=UPI002FE5C309
MNFFVSTITSLFPDSVEEVLNLSFLVRNSLTIGFQIIFLLLSLFLLIGLVKPGLVLWGSDTPKRRNVLIYFMAAVFSFSMIYGGFDYARVKGKDLMIAQVQPSPKVVIAAADCDFYIEGKLNKPYFIQKVANALLDKAYESPWSVKWQMQSMFWDCDFYATSSLEQILSEVSGIAYQKKVTKHYTYYNPAFIKWGFRYLIPENADAESQSLYEMYFKNWVRAYVQGYMYLHYNELFDSELKAYRSAIWHGELSGSEYLHMRFKNNELTLGKNVSDTAPEILGFWLRRHNDDTAPIIWEEVRRKLELFDKFWFDQEIIRLETVAKNTDMKIDPKGELHL